MCIVEDDREREHLHSIKSINEPQHETLCIALKPRNRVLAVIHDEVTTLTFLPVEKF